MSARPRPEPDPAVAAQPLARRWLLFVHQLPASPSNLRVRTWRRLQQMGAIPVKQAVYVLPDSPEAREDFAWLEAEVKGAGGDASVFAAGSLDRWSDDALVAEFRRSRQEAWLALAGEMERLIKRLDARRPRGGRRPAASRLIEGFRARLLALERIDFFGSAGRDRVVSLLARLEERAHPGSGLHPAGRPSGPIDRARPAGRLWVTRPRPGVDRMSSAWLIRRFIDPDARFGFAADRHSLPTADAIPFDMFGVEFSHQGERCTFETLCSAFGIDDAAARRIGQIVHDLDLKDGRFGLPDAGMVGTLVDGLQLASTDDDLLLERGMTMFEALYLTFAGTARLKGPREVAVSSGSVTSRKGPPRKRRRAR